MEKIKQKNRHEKTRSMDNRDAMMRSFIGASKQILYFLYFLRSFVRFIFILGLSYGPLKRPIKLLTPSVKKDFLWQLANYKFNL